MCTTESAEGELPLLTFCTAKSAAGEPSAGLQYSLKHCRRAFCWLALQLKALQASSFC